MPYRSLAERERENWYAPRELVEHVKTVEACDAPEAERQCRNAFADGRLKLKWEPSLVSPWVKAREINPWLAGKPFHGDRNWLDVKIDWDAGIVFDDFDMPAGETPVERQLFVQKQSTFTIWPLAAPAASESEGKPHRRPPGPRPGTVDRYSRLDRELFDEIDELKKLGMTTTAATIKLAGEKNTNGENKVAGTGSLESRAHRLRDRYMKEKAKRS